MSSIRQIKGSHNIELQLPPLRHIFCDSPSLCSSFHFTLLDTVRLYRRFPHLCRATFLCSALHGFQLPRNNYVRFRRLYRPRSHCSPRRLHGTSLHVFMYLCRPAALHLQMHLSRCSRKRFAPTHRGRPNAARTAHCRSYAIKRACPSMAQCLNNALRFSLSALCLLGKPNH